jgi:hypothetical protein
MKLHDYHNALLSKLLCFTEGTELLEGCVIERGYKVFKDTQLKYNLTPIINLYISPVVSLGIFSLVSSDKTMCPEVD